MNYSDRDGSERPQFATGGIVQGPGSIDFAKGCDCVIPASALNRFRSPQEAPEGAPATLDTDVARAVRLWAQRFQPGDRWDPEDYRDLEAALTGTVEAHPTAHHRRQAAKAAPAGLPLHEPTDRDGDNVPSGERTRLTEAHQKQVRFADQNFENWQKAEATIARVEALAREMALNDCDCECCREGLSLIALRAALAGPEAGGEHV